MNKLSVSGLNTDNSRIKIPANKVVLKTFASDDYIIPESNSEVTKVLFHTFRAMESERSLEGNTLTINGDILHNMLMLCENGDIEGITYNQHFEIKDVLKAYENVILLPSGTDIKVECGIVNPRKLSLSADITYQVDVLEERNTALSIDGTESINDEMSVQRKTEQLTAIDVVTRSIENVSVSRDVDIDGNFPQIFEIVYSDVIFTPYEIKTKEDGMIVRSRAKAQIVYKSEEGNVFGYESTFVIEEGLECANASGYEWFYSPAIKNVELRIGENNYGEARIAEIDFQYDIALTGVKNVFIDAVSDAFSTEYCCETTSSDITVYKQERSYFSSLSVNSSVERSSVNADKARTVLTGDVIIKDASCELDREKNKLAVTAVSEINAVCENNLFDDSDEKYGKVTFSYPFKLELDCTNKEAELNFIPSVSVNDIRFRLDSSKIYCDFEAAIRVATTSLSRRSYVTNVSVDKTEPISASPVPMTVCYPSSTDTLWEIAKYYSVTKESIMFSNDLENEDISSRKILLIPTFNNTDRSAKRII